MDFVQGVNRNELFMMSLEENVSSHSWARVVDWFVDSLH